MSTPRRPAPRSRAAPMIATCLPACTGATLPRVKGAARTSGTLAGLLRRLARLWRTHAIRPHHLVVLVLDDVAVPDELPGHDEPCPHPRHLSRVGDHRVLDA